MKQLILLSVLFISSMAFGQEKDSTKTQVTASVVFSSGSEAIINTFYGHRSFLLKTRDKLPTGREYVFIISYQANERSFPVAAVLHGYEISQRQNALDRKNLFEKYFKKPDDEKD